MRESCTRFVNLLVLKILNYFATFTRYDSCVFALWTLRAASRGKVFQVGSVLYCAVETYTFTKARFTFFLVE